MNMTDNSMNSMKSCNSIVIIPNRFSKPGAPYPHKLQKTYRHVARNHYFAKPTMHRNDNSLVFWYVSGVGVYISRIEEGSLAERACLRSGDIILEVNGTPFTSISHEEALKVI